MQIQIGALTTCDVSTLCYCKRATPAAHAAGQRVPVVRGRGDSAALLPSQVHSAGKADVVTIIIARSQHTHTEKSPGQRRHVMLICHTAYRMWCLRTVCKHGQSTSRRQEIAIYACTSSTGFDTRNTAMLLSFYPSTSRVQQQAGGLLPIFAHSHSKYGISTVYLTVRRQPS